MRGLERLSIGEALALGALDRGGGSRLIADTQAGAVIATEVKLREVATKVRFADVVVNTVDAAFQNGEGVLGGVRVGEAAEALLAQAYLAAA